MVIKRTSQQDHSLFFSIVELLLEFGANTETRSDAGKTALMISAYKEQVQVMQKLLDHGADIELGDKNGMTALHIAVDSEKVESVKTLLKNGAKVNATDSNLQWAPLHRIGENDQLLPYLTYPVGPSSYA